MNTLSPKIKKLVLYSFAILCVVCIPKQSHAQQKNTYTSIDSTTYSQYLKADWDGLIETGNEALSLNIDYFYLRMRIAYAHYSKGQYRLAIPHYLKALSFNNDDVNAQYLLMMCYEFSGRQNDALKFSSRISKQKLPDLVTKYQNPVLSSGILFSYSNSSNGDIPIQRQPVPPVDAIQKTTNYFTETNGFISHRLGKSIIINHSLTYLNKNENSVGNSNGTSFTLYNQILHQWAYGLNVQITPFSGFSITPGIQFVKINIPMDYTKLKFKTSLYTLQTQYQFKRIKLGASFLNGEMNDVDNLQVGGHFTWYPKANLNLYYSLDAYWKTQQINTQQVNDIVHKHTLGVKIAKYWWTEASVILPEYNNFYDFSNGALYNSLESNKNTYNFKNIFLTKKSNLSFTMGLTSNTNVSYLIENNDILNKRNRISYKTLTITGGLIWTL